MHRNTCTGQCSPGGKEIGWGNGDWRGFLVGMLYVLLEEEKSHNMTWESHNMTWKSRRAGDMELSEFQWLITGDNTLVTFR